MPVMTGWEFLDVVRRDAHLSSIPVVITSGSHRVSEIMLRPPIVAFLPKPMTFARLLDMVQRTALQGPALR
jgi:CheY-like chemotaxis protein